MKVIGLEKYARYIPFFILASCLVAYYSAYSAGFVWDDDDYVTQNPTLRNWFGFCQIWLNPSALPQYYPMVHTSFWVEYQLWGLDPFGYHLINVILHSCNAILVYKILKHLEVPGALFGAFLFALHPVHVESVAWISERKNVLSGLFYLLALRAYLKWRPVVAMKSAGRKYGILAFIFFLGALASKSVTFSLPAVILLLVYWKRGRILKSDVVSSIPFFVMGIFYGIFTAFIERTHVKAVGVEFDYDFIERLLIAGRACWFYVSKLLFPYPVIFNYPKWEIDPSSVLQWIYPIGILAILAILFVLRKRIGRGPLVAALFFGGTLLPALGFFNVFPMRYSFVADHFQYLASLGPLSLFAAITTKFTEEKLSRNLQIMLAGIVVLALGILSYQQAKVYQDHESLWRDTLKKNPDSWIAMNNLAKYLMDKGEKDEPIELLKRSLQVRSSFESHVNLGALEYGRGQKEKAVEHFNQAIALKPNQAVPYNNKAYILMINGELEKALSTVNKAIAIDPEYSDALATRGQIYYRMELMKEAYDDLNKALIMNPGYTELLFPTADAAFKSGDLASALKWSAHAIARIKDDARVQSLFSKVLIQTVLLKAPEKRISISQGIYAQLGEDSKPGFEALIKYLHENNMSQDAIHLSQALQF